MVNDYITNTRDWDWKALEHLLPQHVLLHLAAYEIDVESEETDAIT